MSSLVGTRRPRAARSVASGTGAGRFSSGALPSRTVRRQPSAPAEPHGLPTEIQRNRLLSAAIRSFDEVGYANTSVAQITSHAHVSRRTFYELFATREECLLAVFEDVLALIERDLAAAGLDGLGWAERVRMGLWTILSFLEREPAMARVCVVHSLQGDAKLLARREALLVRLAAILDEGRTLKGTSSRAHPDGRTQRAHGRHAGEQRARSTQATPLTAEGLVGAALTIVHTRLLRERREPLTALLGELMGLIVLPYLGPAAARRERDRPAPAPPAGQHERGAGDDRFAGDAFAGISMRLTYRTMRVLECVAAEPGASNRRLGVLADVPDQGQMSKLLTRLERLGLLSNGREADARGEANAWRLTAQGLRVTQTIGLDMGTRQ